MSICVVKVSAGAQELSRQFHVATSSFLVGNADMKRGPFDPETIQSFNGMASHLRRAALVAARLGLEKARTAAETMGALGLPAAVLSRSNQLLSTNDLFEKFVPSLFQDYTKRLVIRDVRADALLKNALDRTNQDSYFIRSGVPCQLRRGMICPRWLSTSCLFALRRRTYFRPRSA